MWFYTNYPQRKVLYAENCPEQPYIFQNKQPEKVIVKKTIKKQVQNSLTYHPKIIKSHRFSASMHEQFQYAEHGRQLSSLYKRIRDCKSLPQRRKDHNDPIIYPSYFIREQKCSKDARIDGYFRQIVSIKPKKLNKSLRNIENVRKISSKGQFILPTKKNCSNMIVPKPSKPNYFEKKNDIFSNLPDCQAQAILRYLQFNQIFKITQIFMLKTKMKHYYEEFIVNQVWIEVIRKLGLLKVYH